MIVGAKTTITTKEEHSCNKEFGVRERVFAVNNRNIQA